MMKIKDLPGFDQRGEVLTMAETAKVSTAVEAMVEAGYGAIVVTKGGNSDAIAGIVTERDFMTKVLFNKMDYSKIKLKDIMTTNVQTARLDDRVTQCLQRMSNGRFRHLPVVNDDNELVGMMSQGDFVAYTWPELWKRVKEQTAITMSGQYQPLLILGGVLIYTLILLLFQ